MICQNSESANELHRWKYRGLVEQRWWTTWNSFKYAWRVLMPISRSMEPSQVVIDAPVREHLSQGRTAGMRGYIGILFIPQQKEAFI